MLINRKNMPDDVKKSWAKLSAQQKLFCEKMIELNENQTQACLAAYPHKKSPRAAAVLASKMMIKDNIQKYFSWLQEQRQVFMDKELEISVTKTLKEVAEIAYGRTAGLFNNEWDFKKQDELTQHQINLVAGVDKVRTVLKNSEDDDEGVLVRETIRVRTRDKEKMLELLCRYLGILTENRRLIIDNPVTPEEDKAFNEELRKAAGIPMPPKPKKK